MKQAQWSEIWDLHNHVINCPIHRMGQHESGPTGPLVAFVPFPIFLRKGVASRIVSKSVEHHGCHIVSHLSDIISVSAECTIYRTRGLTYVVLSKFFHRATTGLFIYILFSVWLFCDNVQHKQSLIELNGNWYLETACHYYLIAPAGSILFFGSAC